jgi:hypothetical protein
MEPEKGVRWLALNIWGERLRGKEAVVDFWN